MRMISTLSFFLIVLNLLAQTPTYQTAIEACYEEHLKEGRHENIFLAYQAVQACMVGAPGPLFQMETVKGEVINMAALKGRVVLLNLWFMDCAPCVAEMPAFNELVKKYKDQPVTFVSMTSDDVERLRDDFFPNYQFDFEIIPDARTAFFELLDHRAGFPTTYIMDQKGIIRHVSSGGPTGDDVTKETLAKYIPLLDGYLGVGE